MNRKPRRPDHVRCEWRKRLKFHKFEGDIEFLFRRVADHHTEHLASVRDKKPG
jgi:hypothetical protein